jgi:hypothetical protein
MTEDTQPTAILRFFGDWRDKAAEVTPPDAYRDAVRYVNGHEVEVTPELAECLRALVLVQNRYRERMQDALKTAMSLMWDAAGEVPDTSMPMEPSEVFDRASLIARVTALTECQQMVQNCINEAWQEAQRT